MSVRGAIPLVVLAVSMTGCGDPSSSSDAATPSVEAVTPPAVAEMVSDQAAETANDGEVSGELVSEPTTEPSATRTKPRDSFLRDPADTPRSTTPVDTPDFQVVPEPSPGASTTN